MIEKTALISAILLVIGLVGSLTAVFLINYPIYAIPFISWLMVGLVIYMLVSSPTRVISQSIINTYSRLIDSIVEEFNLHDRLPYFTPSRVSGTPTMIIPSDSKLRRIPNKIAKRLIIYQEDSYMIRIDTLGSLLMNELGGVSAGISSAETLIKSILVSLLSISNDVLISELEGGDLIVVKAVKPDESILEGRSLISNILSQISGPILAEALDEIVRLKDLKMSKREAYAIFEVLH